MKLSRLVVWLLRLFTLPARFVHYILHGGYQPTTKKEQGDQRLLNTLNQLSSELHQLREVMKEQAP